ncbi:MAG: HAD-IIA family hydrolase [Candidatus Heimdallarchaeaceae archaeon]|jgi:phosphoglycolate/pyridoxal phosphate phosphatase family enzyme
MTNNPFSNKDTFLFDGDGVLYKENLVLPGSVELIDKLKDEDKQIFVLTNNSTKTREEFYEKMKKLGISIPIENILTSAFLTAECIAKEHPYASVYVIGENGLKKELSSVGLNVTNHWEEKNTEEIFDFNFNNIDYVITGMDRQLSYVKIGRAVYLLTEKKSRVKFIATNGDMTFPTKQGLIPGGGAMIEILEVLSSRKVEKIIGKPSKQMYTSAIEKANTTKENAVFFGDRLETDILGANNSGITSCLVLSGVTTMDDLGNLNEEKGPDIIVNNLQDVIELFNA